MKPVKFRIKAACRIAHVEHQRFNEAVAADHYPCAPAVARGATRVFDMNDLLALFFYGQMLRQEWPPRLAGKFACLIRGVLERVPDEDNVMVVHTISGGYEGLAESLLRETPRRAKGGSYVLQRFTFDIANARSLITPEIEEELAVHGEDE